MDDDGDHQELDYNARRDVERKMDQEARQRAHQGRRAGAFMNDDEFSEADQLAREMRF